MTWLLVGLLFHLGEPIELEPIPFATHGNCVAAMKEVYRVAHYSQKTGALLRCKPTALYSY